MYSSCACVLAWDCQRDAALQYIALTKHIFGLCKCKSQRKRTPPPQPWLLFFQNRHGLIMGCSVTGRKPLNGPSLPKLKLGPKVETRAQLPEPFGFKKILRESRPVLICLCCDDIILWREPHCVNIYIHIFSSDESTTSRDLGFKRILCKSRPVLVNLYGDVFFWKEQQCMEQIHVYAQLRRGHNLASPSVSQRSFTKDL